MTEKQPKFRPSFTKAIMAGSLCLVGVVLLARLVWPGNGSAGVGMAYFSVDDGKGYFTDSPEMLPPFDHQGKPASRAVMFTCDGGKTLWVGYLERYTPTGLAVARTAVEASRSGRRPEVSQAMVNGLEIKRPGDAEWVRQADFARAAGILNPKCPHSGAHQPQPIVP